MKNFILVILAFLLFSCGGPSFEGRWQTSDNMSIGPVEMKNDGTFIGLKRNPPSGTYVYNDGVLMFKGQDYWGNSKEWIYTNITFVDDNTITGKNSYMQNISMNKR
ncbi:hypothetical protein [Thalassotalea ganghwensis]